MVRRSATISGPVGAMAPSTASPPTRVKSRFTTPRALYTGFLKPRSARAMCGSAPGVTPGALPHIALAERGFKKPVYNTHGVVNRDFTRVGGKAVEGAIAPTGPLIVAEELPADHPSKQVVTDFVKRYEAAFGPNSRNAFSGYGFDAVAVIAAAAPAAMKVAKPGTPEFRQAMRDAIESVKDVRGTQGVYNMTPHDHYGVDHRARVLVQVEKGDWKLVR